MVMHEIRIRIALTPGRVRCALVLFLLLALPRAAGTDDASSTGTIYFPSPKAAYAKLTTIGLDSNHNPVDTVLAANGGTIQFGNSATSPSSTVVAGSASAGTYRLRVTGSLRVDGCMWLKNNNAYAGNGSQDNYRCRFEP